MSTFNISDVVQLKSGGPDMTVKYVLGSDESRAVLDLQYKNNGHKDGDLFCVWFDEDKLEENIFDPNTLEMVDR